MMQGETVSIIKGTMRFRGVLRNEWNLEDAFRIQSECEDIQRMQEISRTYKKLHSYSEFFCEASIKFWEWF